MGHTLVTRLDSQSMKIITDLMAPFRANKIPFGRNCDREEANRVLEYHMTLFHWAKNRDAYYLERLLTLPSLSCRLTVTDARVMAAEEGSWLLFFSVIPGEGFEEMVRCLENKLGTGIYLNPHITLAVSQNREEIETIHRHIRSSLNFPLELGAEGLDLYHIWAPTKKVRSY